MYAIGTHAQDRFTTTPNANYFAAAPQAQPVGTMGYTTQPVAVPGYFVAAPQAAPAGYVTTAPQYVTTARPIATPVAQRTVYREAAPAPRVETRHRSIAKTALIIGGSTAGSAGLGGLIGGKKGALIGAALGGGAASIYEATRR